MSDGKRLIKLCGLIYLKEKWCGQGVAIDRSRPRSRTWITKLQGQAYFRQEQHMDYEISSEKWMMGGYGGMPKERIIQHARFKIDSDPTGDANRRRKQFTAIYHKCTA